MDSTRTATRSPDKGAPRSLTPSGNARSGQSCPRGAGKAIAAASRGPEPPWPRGNKAAAIPPAYEARGPRSAPPRGLCESTTLRAETEMGVQSNRRTREYGPPPAATGANPGPEDGRLEDIQINLPPPSARPFSTERIAGSGNIDRSASPSKARPRATRPPMTPQHTDKDIPRGMERPIIAPQRRNVPQYVNDSPINRAAKLHLT